MKWTEEQINELTSVDQGLGLQYCADCEDIYLEMLTIYLEQGEENLQKLEEFVQQESWKNYIILVHGMKGNALTIGAKAFSEKAKEQEFAGKEERYDFILETYHDFMDLYRCMLKAVQEIVDKGF